MTWALQFLVHLPPGLRHLSLAYVPLSCYAIKTLFATVIVYIVL